MRELSVSELNSISGADIGYDEMVSLWTAAGLFGSSVLFNYEAAAKSINQLGLASATNYKEWDFNTRIGEAGWMYNCYGEKVTWFNNGFFMVVDIS